VRLYPSVMSSSILLKLRSQLLVRYLDLYFTDSVLFTTLQQLNLMTEIGFRRLVVASTIFWHKRSKTNLKHLFMLEIKVIDKKICLIIIRH
jgi:hypothetical protein